jgi:hypothetical protein
MEYLDAASGETAPLPVAILQPLLARVALRGDSQLRAEPELAPGVERFLSATQGAQNAAEDDG